MQKKNKSVNRRNCIKGIVVGGLGVIGAPAAARSDGEIEPEDETCPPGSCGGGNYYARRDDSVVHNDNYFSTDFRGGASVTTDYYGTYTNASGTSYYHEFVTSGSSSAARKSESSSSWSDDDAIIGQTAKIINHKTTRCRIIGDVDPGSGDQWVGASKDEDGTSSETYQEILEICVEAAVSELSNKIGYALTAAHLIEALSSEFSNEPDDENEWILPYDYSNDATNHCTNTAHFAISTPNIGDNIEITTRQEANIPTVNDSNEVVFAELTWEQETNDPGNYSLSSNQDKWTKVPKSELPPIAEVREMAENSSIYRTNIPFTVTSRTSSNS